MANDKDLQHLYSKLYARLEAINPCDAIFGGRTNATTPFYEPKEYETLKYVDYTSLYPYTCKYGIYPLGHPEIYYGEDIPDSVQGLLKCKMVPPSNLFHPVLPIQK